MSRISSARPCVSSKAAAISAMTSASLRLRSSTHAPRATARSAVEGLRTTSVKVLRPTTGDVAGVGPKGLAKWLGADSICLFLNSSSASGSSCGSTEARGVCHAAGVACTAGRGALNVSSSFSMLPVDTSSRWTRRSW
jgi:hypothetical protein